VRVVIPAAGVGERLRPYTLTVPKVMISLAGKPLIGHILDAVTFPGVTSISLIVGYKNEQVEEYVSRNYSHLRLDYPFQAERKGLGHAVLQGLEDKEEEVLILLGDTVFDVDYEHFTSIGQNAIAVVKVDDPHRFGIAEIDTENQVTRLVEKPDEPKSDLALAGMYYIKDQRILKAAIEKLITDNITTRGEYQLTDALQYMLETGEVIQAVEINGWYDCGTIDSLLESHRFLLKHNVSEEIERSCTIHPPVFIHPDAKVTNSTIGPYVTIDAGSRVSGSTIEETIIGRETSINNVKLGHRLISNHSVEGNVESGLSERIQSELKLS
jgi:glucose-1-phosphate thymidylyltransferase